MSDAGVTRRTFWQRDGLPSGRRDGCETLENMFASFDEASLIVAYNGRDFDMQVLRQYYGGDEERWAAHVRKLHDPMHEANRASGGRRVRLATLLRLNGLRGKHGEGGDAPGLWRAGKLDQLERYCARDAEALAELVTRAWYAHGHACRAGEGRTE